MAALILAEAWQEQQLPKVVGYAGAEPVIRGSFAVNVEIPGRKRRLGSANVALRIQVNFVVNVVVPDQLEVVGYAGAVR